MTKSVCTLGVCHPAPPHPWPLNPGAAGDCRDAVPTPAAWPPRPALCPPPPPSRASARRPRGSGQTTVKTSFILPRTELPTRPLAPSPGGRLWNAILQRPRDRQETRGPEGWHSRASPTEPRLHRGHEPFLLRGERPAGDPGGSGGPLPPRTRGKRPSPMHRAPRGSPLPSFLAKAFNKDFIFPPTPAADRHSLYNLLGRAGSEQGRPAPRRRSSGRPGTVCLRASVGMPDPARGAQRPAHGLPVSGEPTVCRPGLKPRGRSQRPSCEQRYSAPGSRAGEGGLGAPASGRLSPDYPRKPGWGRGHGCSDAPGAKYNAPCFANFMFKEKAKFPWVLLADAASKSRGEDIPVPRSPAPAGAGGAPECLCVAQISFGSQTRYPPRPWGAPTPTFFFFKGE